jgi:hypothetical protein
VYYEVAYNADVVSFSKQAWAASISTALETAIWEIFEFLNRPAAPVVFSAAYSTLTTSMAELYANDP